MKKRTKAFTLVELLVVVAIIALLVSILLPTLGRAKDQARRVVCASNLRNCGMTLHLYSTTNDGRYPPSPAPGFGYHYDPNYITDDMRDQLLPYVEGSFESWKCPAVAHGAFFQTHDYPIPDGWSWCYITYSYFPGRKWPQFLPSDDVRYNDADLREPLPDREHLVDIAAEQVILQDTYMDEWEVSGSSRYNHGKGLIRPGWLIKTGVSGDGANLLFYDGHAKWYGFDNLEVVGSCCGLSEMFWSVLP